MKNRQNFVHCHRHTLFSSKNSARGYEEEAPSKGCLFKKSISSKQTNKNLISNIPAVFLQTPISQTRFIISSQKERTRKQTNASRTFQ